MIGKIYGLFTVKTKMFSNLNFVIMENVTRMNNKSNYKVTFDMKGSTFHRKAKLKTQFWHDKLDCQGVLKDLNFIEIAQAIGSKLINLTPTECNSMASVLEADS